MFSVMLKQYWAYTLFLKHTPACQTARLPDCLLAVLCPYPIVWQCDCLPWLVNQIVYQLLPEIQQSVSVATNINEDGFDDVDNNDDETMLMKKLTQIRHVYIVWTNQCTYDYNTILTIPYVHIYTYISILYTYCMSYNAHTYPNTNKYNK